MHSDYFSLKDIPRCSHMQNRNPSEDVSRSGKGGLLFMYDLNFYESIFHF